MSQSKQPYQNRIIEYRVMRAGDIQAHPQNWRVHPSGQIDALKRALDAIGWADTLTFNQRTGHCLDGHARLGLCEADELIPVLLVDMSEAEELVYLATHDTITSMAETDDEKLWAVMDGAGLEHLEVLQAIHPEYAPPPSEDDIAALMAAMGEGFAEGEDEPSDLGQGDVPDALWPTDNEWGVPLLDINLMADAVDLPVEVWGEVARTTRMRGTWLFYTEDARFEALWRDPSPILNSRCVNVVEPNFSCYRDMPMAVGLWAIYRKRWLARYWQSKGVRVFVDLNVNPKFYDLNLMGVPKGWTAWATRGYMERLEYTVQEYEIAVKHAGSSSILFVVYGGGKAVKKACLERGWMWIPEVMDSKRGRLPRFGEVDNG